MARYRPYVVLVVAVAVVVLPFGRDGDNETVARAGPSSASAATTDSPVAGADPLPSARIREAGSLANPRGSAAPVAAGAPAVTARVSAGVGTEAALSAKDCDRRTGRVRAPYVFTPPCVVPWAQGADNGGATAIGVSRTTVKVVVFNDPSQGAAAFSAFGAAPPPDAQQQQMEQDWRKGAEVLEHVFRMWGRKFELVFFSGTGSDEVAQRADAATIANQIKPFAVIDHNSTHLVLYAELAGRGILSFPSGASGRDTLAQPPYRWSITLGPDELLIGAFAEYVGKRLQGHPARWAGDITLQTRPRVFGLVHPKPWDRAEIKKQLAKFGVQTVGEVEYDPNDIPGQQERARLAVSRLKGAGATTVIAGADVLYTPILTKEATSQQYSPEWVVTSFLGQDLDLFARLNDQTQWQHAFGVGASVGVGSSQELPQDLLYHWYWGADDGGSSIGALDLGPLATGFHLAGPILTPQTFRDGLFSMAPSGGVSCKCVLYPQRSYGRWGVYPFDDYTGFEDFTELWWDPTAYGPDNANLVDAPGTGKYRYVDGGKRYLLTQWPTSEPKVFDRTNSIEYYAEPPPQDRPPGPYPCDGCPSTRQ